MASWLRANETPTLSDCSRAWWEGTGQTLRAAGFRCALVRGVSVSSAESRTEEKQGTDGSLCNDPYQSLGGRGLPEPVAARTPAFPRFFLLPSPSESMRQPLFSSPATSQVQVPAMGQSDT